MALGSCVEDATLSAETRSVAEVGRLQTAGERALRPSSAGTAAAFGPQHPPLLLSFPGTERARGARLVRALSGRPTLRPLCPRQTLTLRFWEAEGDDVPAVVSFCLYGKHESSVNEELATLELFAVMRQEKKAQHQPSPILKGGVFAWVAGKQTPREGLGDKGFFWKGTSGSGVKGKEVRPGCQDGSRGCADELVVLTASREPGLPGTLGRPATRHVSCALWGGAGKPGALPPSSGQRCSWACYLFDSSPRCSGLECRWSDTPSGPCPCDSAS